MITKKVEKKEEYYLTFTDEELSQLGLREGDKLDWEIKEDGVFLKKWVPMDLEIENWTKETLLFLIQESLEKNLTINEVIVNILDDVVKRHPDHDNSESSTS
jgi:hypothetical protein